MDKFLIKLTETDRNCFCAIGSKRIHPGILKFGEIKVPSTVSFIQNRKACTQDFRFRNRTYTLETEAACCELTAGAALLGLQTDSTVIWRQWENDRMQNNTFTR